MKITGEIIVGALILIILAIFLNHSYLLMPSTAHNLLMVGLIMVFLVFVGLVWREQSSDERDLIHIQKSGRLSFFIGAAILVIGIIFQSATHDIDPWLLYSLFGMVLTKIISRVFHKFRN